jgi:hypothetical protein
MMSGDAPPMNTQVKALSMIGAALPSWPARGLSARTLSDLRPSVLRPFGWRIDSSQSVGRTPTAPRIAAPTSARDGDSAGLRATYFGWPGP